jgi:solute carrier family 25 S-adenosylmethionine transporter 26
MFSENSASFVAGAFAGLVTDLSLHPLDTIKTRLQTNHHNNKFAAFNNNANKKSLAKSLFQGLTPALCGSCPSGAFFFGTYQFVSRKLEDKNKNGNNGSTTGNIIYKSLIASCFGEAAACLIRAPVDIVKNNMQVGKSGKESVALLFSSSKFFTVYQALLFRELPFAMLQLPTLELLKQNALVRCIALHLSAEYWNVIEDKKVAATVVSGFFAGGFAAFLTTPSDVFKTRNAVSNHTKTSFFEFLFKSNHSLKDLFRGGASRVFMISIGGSIFFGTQEWAKRKLIR